MVEFDMLPGPVLVKRSYTYRPGLGHRVHRAVKPFTILVRKTPLVKRGKRIQGKNKAKIYTADGEWIGEWVGGAKPEYFYGSRKDVERTQWISGDGDGLLVWDHNGNGIIDDTTELMSEFDVKGEHAFANGLEKLAHYFDKDGNGVVEAHEMQGLMFWIDDGDAKTEEGELIPPWKLGITEILFRS